MHPLLKRQLKRIGLDEATVPTSLDGWQQLLERVNQSYLESDQGRELLERSIALSSREMQELNEQLRRTSESQLAGERDKLQTVLRSIGDGLCVVDGHWNIVLLNPEGERLWGLTEKEVVGRQLHDMISLSYGTKLTEPIFTQMLLDDTTQGGSFRTDDGLLTSITGQASATETTSDASCRTGALLVAVRGTLDDSRGERHISDRSGKRSRRLCRRFISGDYRMRSE